MTRYLRLFSILIVALFTLIPAPSGLAQERTPVALPTSPDPALCAIAPRSRENFEALVAMGQANPATPAPQGAAGEPADEATIEAVTQTAVELFACYAAGDLLRASSLWTDAYLARMYALVPYPAADLVALQASPEPEALVDRSVIMTLRDVTILPDGRVGSFLELAYPDGSTDTQYGVVALVDGRYRLDEIWDVESSLDSPPPAATPIAFTEPSAAAMPTLLEGECVAGCA